MREGVRKSEGGYAVDIRNAVFINSKLLRNVLCLEPFQAARSGVECMNLNPAGLNELQVERDIGPDAAGVNDGTTVDQIRANGKLSSIASKHSKLTVDIPPVKYIL